MSFPSLKLTVLPQQQSTEPFLPSERGGGGASKGEATAPWPPEPPHPGAPITAGAAQSPSHPKHHQLTLAVTLPNPSRTLLGASIEQTSLNSTLISRLIKTRVCPAFKAELELEAEALSALTVFTAPFVPSPLVTLPGEGV